MLNLFSNIFINSMPHVYHVGDKVRVKHLIYAESDDYPYGLSSDKCRAEGQIFTIKKIDPDFCNQPEKQHYKNRRYYNGDPGKYALKEIGLVWHSSMFEPVLEGGALTCAASKATVSANPVSDKDMIPVRTKHVRIFY